MSEQDNVEIVRRGYEAFGRGDIEALLGLFDEHIEWVTPGPSDLPTAGHRRGVQQVREFFGTLSEVLDMQRVVPDAFVAQGDRVVVLGQLTAGIRPSGKALNEGFAHVFVVANGKIVSFREYLDTTLTVTERRDALART